MSGSKKLVRHHICRGRRGRHSQKGGEQEGHSIAEQSDEMVNLLWGLDLVVSPTAPNHIYLRVALAGNHWKIKNSFFARFVASGGSIK